MTIHIHVYMYVCVYIYLANKRIHIWNICVHIHVCTPVHTYVCVYTCILLFAKLQLSSEDTELQPVDISIISLPCKKKGKNLGLKSKWTVLV